MLDTKTIGIRITEARKKINISQSLLAEQLFISSQAVGKWERGESMPDIITLNRLAEIFGVNLNYFSEGTKVSPLAEQPGNFPAGQTQNLDEKPRWDMSRSNWLDADFSGLNNLHEKFSSSNMQRCKFIGSNLSGLLLKYNHVDNCDFTGSHIGGSHIRGSHLNKNIFKNCSMINAEFTGSYINLCDLSGTNLTGTRFTTSYIYGCDLNGVDFTQVTIKSGGLGGVAAKTENSNKNAITGAIWNRSSFLDSHIADITFSGTMEYCSFENCAFTRVTFKNAILINTFSKTTGT